MGAAGVLDDLVDRVADQAQRSKDATQDNEVAACEARSKQRFNLSAKALKAEAAYRAVQEDDIRRRFTSVTALDAVVHRIADNEAAARRAALGRELARIATESESRDQGLAAALAVERDEREKQHEEDARERLVSRSLRRAQNEVHDKEVRQSFEDLGERLDTNVTFLGERVDAAEEAREEGDTELGERVDAEAARNKLRQSFTDLRKKWARDETELRSQRDAATQRALTATDRAKRALELDRAALANEPRVCDRCRRPVAAPTGGAGAGFGSSVP